MAFKKTNPPTDGDILFNFLSVRYFLSVAASFFYRKQYLLELTTTDSRTQKMTRMAIMNNTRKMMMYISLLVSQSSFNLFIRMVRLFSSRSNDITRSYYISLAETTVIDIKLSNYHSQPSQLTKKLIYLGNSTLQYGYIPNQVYISEEEQLTLILIWIKSLQLKRLLFLIQKLLQSFYPLELVALAFQGLPTSQCILLYLHPLQIVPLHLESLEPFRIYDSNKLILSFFQMYSFSLHLLKHILLQLECCLRLFVDQQIFVN